MKSSTCMIHATIICTFFVFGLSQLILEVGHPPKDIHENLLHTKISHKQIKDNPHVVLTYYNRHNMEKPSDHFQKLFLSMLMNIAMEESLMNRLREREERLHSPLEIFKNLPKNKINNNNNKEMPKDICDICEGFCREREHEKKVNIINTQNINHDNKNQLAFLNNSMNKKHAENVSDIIENHKRTVNEPLTANISAIKDLINSDVRSPRHPNVQKLNKTIFEQANNDGKKISLLLDHMIMHSNNTVKEISKLNANLSSEKLVNTDEIKNNASNESSPHDNNIQKTSGLEHNSLITHNLESRNRRLTNFLHLARKNDNLNRKRRNMMYNIEKFNILTSHNPSGNVLPTDLSEDLNNYSFETTKQDSEYAPKISFLQPIFYDVKKDERQAIYEETPKPKILKEKYDQPMFFALPTIICIGVVSFILYYIIRFCLNVIKQQRPMQTNIEHGEHQHCMHK